MWENRKCRRGWGFFFSSFPRGRRNMYVFDFVSFPFSFFLGKNKNKKNNRRKVVSGHELSGVMSYTCLGTTTTSIQQVPTLPR